MLDIVQKEQNSETDTSRKRSDTSQYEVLCEHFVLLLKVPCKHGTQDRCELVAGTCTLIFGFTAVIWYSRDGYGQV